MASDRAEIEQLSLRAVGLKLPMGLRLASLSVEAASVSLLGPPVALEAPEDAAVEAVVTDKDLQDYLNAKGPSGLRDFFVQLTDGSVHVHATARKIIEVRAAAQCHIVVREGRFLDVALDRVDVIGVNARSLVQGFIDGMNPVFDAESLPLPTVIDRVEVGDGRMTIFAHAAPRLRS
ncbi:MAG: LmeA family phospholipid-binding protein [Armatimonadetes bacterium]|nr:LmeA family phospholipid-binding protein [Armatimonadota bacterium]